MERDKRFWTNEFATDAPFDDGAEVVDKRVDVRARETARLLHFVAAKEVLFRAEVVDRRRGKISQRKFKRGAEAVELTGLFAVFDVIFGAIGQKRGGEFGERCDGVCFVAFSDDGRGFRSQFGDITAIRGDRFRSVLATKINFFAVAIDERGVAGFVPAKFR